MMQGKISVAVGVGMGLLACLGAFAADGVSLEARFQRPSPAGARPCVALSADVMSGEGEEKVLRQIERANELGVGGVLLALPRMDERVWQAFGRVADCCRRLGLELGFQDFGLEGESGLQSTRRLSWSVLDWQGGSVALDRFWPCVFLPVAESNRLARCAVPLPIDGAVQPQSIVDLSQNALPTGGVWKICRFDLAAVEPARLDEFEGQAVFRHVNRVLSACQTRLTHVYGNTVSWYQFAGPGRRHWLWPRDLPETFVKRSGLSLMRYLPALAGIPVGGETTAAYVRQQVASDMRDLWRERFARNVNELVHEAGLEAGIEVDQALIAPEEVALYFRRPTLLPARDEAHVAVNVRSAGSARALGRRMVIGRLDLGQIVATPAATLLPFPWKHEADRLFQVGVTRLLVETEGGLPSDDEAFRVLSLGLQYASRCQVLLQAGEPAADFLVWSDQALAPLEGYSCDYTRPAVLESAVVKDGAVLFDSDRAYRAVAVSSQEVLRDKASFQRVRRLAASGVGVWLVGSGAEDAAELSRLQKQVGGGCQIFQRSGEGVPLPDFEWAVEGEGRMSMRFLHRRTEGQEIYFVMNDSPDAGVAVCRFRDTGGGVPTRWDPVSGETGETVEGVVITKDKRVVVPLFMAPHETCFVVFGRDA